MKRSITIKYHWKRAGENPEVLERHVDALEERAFERIQEMMGEGCTSGQLSDYVRMGEEDGEDGVEYSGWWEAINNPTDDTLTHCGIISRSIAPFYYGGWDQKTNQPFWVKDPDDALSIPVAELGETVNRVAPHTRGCVNGVVNPTEY